MSRLALLLGAVCALLAGPAHAEWRRAESEHFIVYSDGSERSLRDYTAKLERFDALLRVRFGPGPQGEFRKLPVYLVDDARALRVAQPGLPEGIDGYYSSSDNDIYAVLVRGRDDDVLLHEYAHHFMAQRGGGRYPGWLSEGFADYFATATVSERGRTTFGLPDPGRQQALQANRWLPMDQLLRAKGSFDIDSREGRQMYYAQSWLLTHWLLADPARATALATYLQAINSGQDHLEAWQAVFGMTPDQLATALKAYLRGRIYYHEGEIPVPSPTITVTALTPAADAVLLPMVDARNDHRPGVDGPALLQIFRTAAGRFPEDALALVALGRAEMQWGDRAAAETALAAALERQPDHVEGLLLMAELLTERAEAADDDAHIALLRQAQGHLAKALDADPSDYRIYAALARIRRASPDYPTDNDLQTWLIAVELAPQVQSIRGDAAIAMMHTGRYADAITLLTPILNDPHGGPGSRQARALLDQIAERRAAAQE